jgi:hypothetical protein
MSQAVLPPEHSGLDDDQPLVIELKQPLLAAVLAWLIPGLGHLYQGRTGKGMLFFVCVLGTFVYGLYLGQGKVVYASVPGHDPWRWQYYCQMGVGMPALPALVQRSRFMQERPLLWGGLMAPPRNEQTSWIDDSNQETTQPDELAKWIVDMHPHYELGTVYTVIAGLLNLLVICDAYAGPLILKHRGEPPGQTDPEGAASSSPGGSG